MIWNLNLFKLLNAWNAMRCDVSPGDPCENSYRTLIIFRVENRSKDGSSRGPPVPPREPACCQAGRSHRDWEHPEVSRSFSLPEKYHWDLSKTLNVVFVASFMAMIRKYVGERVMEERAMGRPGIRRRPDASGEGMTGWSSLICAFTHQLFEHACNAVLCWHLRDWFFLE